MGPLLFALGFVVGVVVPALGGRQDTNYPILGGVMSAAGLILAHMAAG